MYLKKWAMWQIIFKFFWVEWSREYMSHTVYVWRSEDKLRDSSFLYHVGPGDKLGYQAW